MALKVFIFSFLFCLVEFSQSKEFPKNIPRCRPTDDDCLVRVTNHIVHNYPHGYPDLNLQNIDPFKLSDIIIKGDSSSPINFNLEMTDLTLSGYANMNFSKVSGFKKEPKDLKIVTESVSEQVILKGKYKIAGKLLVVPINGEGDITCIMKNLHIKTRSMPKVVLKDGEEYLKLDLSGFQAKAKADHMTIKLTNLFNGDKVLGENMNKIINENWEVLWEELEPSVVEQLKKVNKETIDNIGNSFPYKEMLILDE